MNVDSHPTALGDFGRFVIQRRLGAGEFAVVYQARDRKTGRSVALKLLETVTAPALARFEREFGRLSHVEHPNLIRLYELHADEQDPFFTMELVSGTDLVTWVREDVPADSRPPSAGLMLGQEVRASGATAYRPCTERGIARLRAALPQLVCGLEAIHTAGLVHWDLRPGNVRVTPQGRLVVLDYGLMTHATDSDDAEDHVGTAAYMAPEQWDRATASQASDWYAVGVMLFEALTGSLPFSGSAHEVFVRKRSVGAPPPSLLVPCVPPDLDAVCTALLCIDPARRPTGEGVLRMLGA
jgi:eukaryotic-like serine/threonine-protein kinase